jgi:RND family efflux transporter MFP subunit
MASKKTENATTMLRVAVQLVLSITLLAAVALATKMLIDAKQEPVAAPQPSHGPLINVETAKAHDIEVRIKGYGTVKPRVQVQVVPQVSGKVVEAHAALVSGGFIAAEEPLVRIDDADYKLAVQKAEAQVAAAEVKLDLEIAEAQVARAEWESLHPDEPAPPLVMRKPQINQAKAALAAAAAALSEAKLALKRTTVSVPFDCRVLSESIDAGQYIVAGQPVATVYGTQTVEIAVPLEDRELRWFDVPVGPDAQDPDGQQRGSPVDVMAEFAGGRHVWQGWVVRTEGAVDERSRMVNVVVQVPHPFDDESGRPPLVPGMFVEVAIRGTTLHDVVPVPRHALHHNERLWVIQRHNDDPSLDQPTDGDEAAASVASMTEGADDPKAGSDAAENEHQIESPKYLRIRRAEVVRKDREFAYLRSGIKQGEMVVVSPLDTVTDGMRVRTSLQPNSYIVWAERELTAQGGQP